MLISPTTLIFLETKQANEQRRKRPHTRRGAFRRPTSAGQKPRERRMPAPLLFFLRSLAIPFSKSRAGSSTSSDNSLLKSCRSDSASLTPPGRSHESTTPRALPMCHASYCSGAARSPSYGSACRRSTAMPQRRWRHRADRTRAAMQTAWAAWMTSTPS